MPRTMRILCVFAFAVHVDKLTDKLVHSRIDRSQRFKVRSHLGVFWFLIDNGCDRDVISGVD